ncbi:MAG: hypothetical protein AAF402_01060 [Pseudomonadota bacterium]
MHIPRLQVRLCDLIAMTCLCFCFANTPVLANADAKWLPEARYSVNYAGTDAGHLQVSVEMKGDRIAVTTVSELSAVASLFLKGYTSETVFELQNDSLALISGSERVIGKSSGGRSYRITDDHHLVYGTGESIPVADRFPPHAAAFPLQLVFADIQQIGETSILEVSSKRARRYTYKQPELDTIDTKNGSLEAWRIERFRVDRPESTVTMWIATTGHRMPHRIVVVNKGRTTTMELTR